MEEWPATAEDKPTPFDLTIKEGTIFLGAHLDEREIERVARKHQLTMEQIAAGLQVEVDRLTKVDMFQKTSAEQHPE